MNSFVGITMSASVHGTAEFIQLLEGMSGRRAAWAYARALNDTGFQALKPAWEREIVAQFDRPTEYIRKSIFVRKAKPENLSVIVEPALVRKKGIEPQKILQAQEFGGRRVLKRFERALQRIGILPAGYQAVIPEIPFPGSDDGNGNLHGGFITQLLSYFHAFPPASAGNMKDSTRKRLHKGTKKQAGRRYFVSYGRLRGQHLAPGIWAAMGTHGVDVRPVVLFTRAGTYEARISRERVAQRADAQAFLDERVRERIMEAAGG